MKTRIEFSGDFFEDKDDFKMIIHVYDLMIAIHEARKIISARLSLDEDMSGQEIRILKELQEILDIEGLNI